MEFIGSSVYMLRQLEFNNVTKPQFMSETSPSFTLGYSRCSEYGWSVGAGCNQHAVLYTNYGEASVVPFSDVRGQRHHMTAAMHMDPCNYSLI